MCVYAWLLLSFFFIYIFRLKRPASKTERCSSFCAFLEIKHLKTWSIYSLRRNLDILIRKLGCYLAIFPIIHLSGVCLSNCTFSWQPVGRLVAGPSIWMRHNDWLRGWVEEEPNGWKASPVCSSRSCFWPMMDVSQSSCLSLSVTVSWYNTAGIGLIDERFADFVFFLSVIVSTEHNRLCYTVQVYRKIFFQFSQAGKWSYKRF